MLATEGGRSQGLSWRSTDRARPAPTAADPHRQSGFRRGAPGKSGSGATPQTVASQVRPYPGLAGGYLPQAARLRARLRPGPPDVAICVERVARPLFSEESQGLSRVARPALQVARPPCIGGEQGAGRGIARAGREEARRPGAARPA